VICLEDIINQIIQIDSIAFENKEKNEEFLIKKKQEYENKLVNYRDKKIALAKKKANFVYESIDANLEKEERLQAEKIKRISIQMENRYLQVENDVIKKIFNKLFVLEG
jgi:hypothetical protein